jgi:glycine cleavage system H protein
MNFPQDLKYTKDHEWARIEGNTVTVGITDHAQSALGDIVYVDLPKEGRVLKTGETFGVVESIKAVSDLYSPITGKVLAVNQDLPADPAVVNREPYSMAWMVKIEASQPAELAGLMDAAAYTAYVASLK